jgi:hypothetical protein
VSLRGIISKERQMIGPVEDKTPLFLTSSDKQKKW